MTGEVLWLTAGDGSGLAGLSSTTMGLAGGEVLGLTAGDVSGLAGLSSMTMGLGGGDTHLALEVDGSLVAWSDPISLVLFLRLFSPTPLDVPWTGAAAFSSSIT